MASPREHFRNLCDGPPLQMGPGLYQFTLPMPFRLNHVHLYLVEADAGFILIDTGVNTPEAFASLKRKLGDLGLDFNAITQVVITHFHSDHCGQAAHIRELAGAEIVMGRMERTIFERVQSHSDEAREEQFVRHGLPTSQASRYAEVLPQLKRLAVPFDVDLHVDHGQTLLAKRRRLEAFVTPGHTPGHVCLFMPEEKIMFSGDHILQKITPNISFHSYSGADPLGEYLDSLRATLRLGATLLLPSHGPLVEDPSARIHELLGHHERRLEICLEALKQDPTTAYDVSLSLFDAPLDHVGRWMALGETLAHLEHLVHQGLVSKVEEDRRVFFQRV